MRLVAFASILTLLTASTVRGAPLTATTHSARAAAAFARARDAFENGQHPIAQDEFRRALALDPNFASALSYLGVELGGAEGLRLAARAVELSAALPPPERLLLRSNLEGLQGKARESRSSLREAAQLAPDEWRIFYYIGRDAELARLSGIAIVALRRASKLNPQAAPVWNTLGFTLANQEDFPGAIQALRNYEKLLPNDPNPPDSLGEIYVRAGQLDEAEQAFGREAKIAPHSVSAYEGIAQVRFMRGDYEGGRAMADKARIMAELFAEKQQAERLLAWSYAAQGRFPEGLASIRETEARARKHGATFAEGLAGVNEARMLVESGDARGAMEKARDVIAKDLARLSGTEAATIKLRAQLTLLLGAVQLHQPADARKAQETILTLHRELPERGEMILAVHFAAGMVALGENDPVRATNELAHCRAEDMYCAWKLIFAQRAAGQAAAAAETRSQLLQRYWFDEMYLDIDPAYTFVRGRLLAESSGSWPRSGASSSAPGGVKPR